MIPCPAPVQGGDLGLIVRAAVVRVEDRLVSGLDLAFRRVIEILDVVFIDGRRAGVRDKVAPAPRGSYSAAKKTTG
jgi:hypothetical protein